MDLIINNLIVDALRIFAINADTKIGLVC